MSSRTSPTAAVKMNCPAIGQRTPRPLPAGAARSGFIWETVQLYRRNFLTIDYEGVIIISIDL